MRLTLPNVPVEDLIVPACIIDVSSKAHTDYIITPKDIIDFEERHGNITERSLVVGYTGWGKRHPFLHVAAFEHQGWIILFLGTHYLACSA